jgi:hypothetical protein
VAPLRLAHCWGAFAYSISPKGARAALDSCIPLHDRPPVQFPDTGWSWIDQGIDGPLNQVYPNAKAFACLPQLVIHAGMDESSRKDTDSS